MLGKLIMPHLSTSKWIRVAVICLILLGEYFWSSGTTSQAFAADDVQRPPSTRVYIPSILFGKSNASSSGPDWLSYVNSYRAMANLPEVSENTSWSNGDVAHSRYIVKTDILIHNEDAGNPWYTPDGMAAAQAGNLMGSYDSAASDRHAIDSWMQAPFHALGILDPSLNQIGFGSYRETDGGLQMGATLDVLRGLGSLPPTVRFPIMWPGQGAVVPIGKFWGETPDPLTSCPGYKSPSGLPILLQIGPGNLSPSVTSYSISSGGTPIESCVFTEETYKNPAPEAQNVGRAILNERDAVVLIPITPLTPGAAYTVSITTNGQTYSWSFSVATTTQDSEIAAP